MMAKHIMYLINTFFINKIKKLKYLVYESMITILLKYTCLC